MTISLKLADFGLAMDVREAIYTVCGTPTYVAPEILSEIGKEHNVDGTVKFALDVNDKYDSILENKLFLQVFL